MKIAIPTRDGRLNSHFGHSREFTLVEVDVLSNNIINEEIVEAPPHEPGVLPKWLHSLDVTVIITGGMGARAVNLFKKNGIEVVLGAREDNVKQVTINYLTNNLEIGVNQCDH